MGESRPPRSCDVASHTHRRERHSKSKDAGLAVARGTQNNRLRDGAPKCGARQLTPAALCALERAACLGKGPPAIAWTGPVPGTREVSPVSPVGFGIN